MRIGKRLSALLLAAGIIAMLGFPSFAAGDNLIKNSGFENGLEGWAGNGAAQPGISDKAYAGENALLLTARQTGYDSVRQDVTAALNSAEPGYFSFGAMVRAAGEDIPRVCVVLELTDAAGETRWVSSPEAAAGSVYTETAARFVELQWEGALQAASVYLHTPGCAADILVDNVYLYRSFTLAEGRDAAENYKPLTPAPHAEELVLPENTRQIVFTLGSSTFFDGDSERPIDPDNDEVKAETAEGRTVLPVRALTEALGGMVEWDETDRRADISLPGRRIQMTEGEPEVTTEDGTLICEVPLAVRNGRLTAPLRFLVQDVLGLALLWDGAAGTASILTDVPCAAYAAAEGNAYRQWRPVEYVFQTPKEYTLEEKPWLTVNFSADFTAPDGTVLTIPGFWDGGNLFKLRFTATMPGTWRAETKCFDDLSLHGLSLVQQYEPPAEEETNPIYRHGGFLRASEDGRYLTYTDGTPFYYLSETIWYTPSDQFLPIDEPASIYSVERMGEEFFKNKGITSAYNTILDLRQQQGFTVIRTGFLGNINGNSVQALYHSKRELDIDAWQITDKYFRSIMEHGMVQLTFPAWVDAAGGWASYFEYRELLDYMNARYGAWALAYGMGPEYNDSSKQASGLMHYTLDALAYAHDIDPYRRANTVQPIVWNLTGAADKLEWDKEYLDFLMLEGGHETPYGISEDYYKSAWDNRRGGEPVPYVVVETTWDGIIRNNYPEHDDYVIRFNQYRGWMLGAKGADHGVQGLWYPVLHYDDHTFEDAWGATNEPWWDAIYRPSAKQMRHMRTLMESVDWWELEPMFGASPSLQAIQPPPQGDGAPPDSAYKKAVAAATGDLQQIMVYIPRTSDKAADIPLTISGAAGEYAARWFDPREGKFADGGTTAFDGGKLTLPVRPDTEDWILLLEKQ